MLLWGSLKRNFSVLQGQLLPGEVPHGFPQGVAHSDFSECQDGAVILTKWTSLAVHPELPGLAYNNGQTL